MHPSTDLAALLERCSAADSFAELLPIALEELHKFPEGCGGVCGPISTGGYGNPEKNLRAFAATIKEMLRLGNPVFSQAPYEERIFAFRKRWQDADSANAGQYYRPILDDFYLPLFETGLVKQAWFIPGWRSSQGAVWEHQQLKRLGADIKYLSEGWLNGILIATNC